MVLLRKDEYNAKIKNIEDKIPDITNLATKTILNAKINQVKGETPKITILATNASVNSKMNEVKGKISNISNLANTIALTAAQKKNLLLLVKSKKLTITQKLMKLKNNYWS